MMSRQRLSVPGWWGLWDAGVALTALWALLTASSCAKREPPPPPPPPVVEVMEATATAVPLSTEFIGQLDSPQNVGVRARVEAYVEKIPFVDGSEVKEGDLLFVLDKRPYQERLAAAQGGLAEAKANLKKCEADVARLTPLAEKKAVPKEDLDNALASVEVAKANVVTAQSRVESAQLDLGYCEPKAPVSGLIGEAQVSVGELVGKGAPTLMATISTLDPIWFYCNVGEVQYLRAMNEANRLGTSLESLPVHLLLSDGSIHPSPGRFVFFDRAVDPTTGTLRVRAEFPNPARILRPGMFARIRVDLGTRADSILIPQRAVAEVQGRSFMWLVGADNKATRVAVKVGQEIGSEVLVLEGLKAGDRFVVEGLQKVREGMLVTPQAATGKADAPAGDAAAAPAPAAAAPGAGAPAAGAPAAQNPAAAAEKE